MIDDLRKLFIGMFGLATTMGITILIMIKGYGLTPQNWWWIIGGTFLSLIVSQGTVALCK